jgi:hypothetical protein
MHEVRVAAARMRAEGVARVLAATVSRRDAAQILGVAPDTVTRRIYAGRLVGFVCRNRWWLPTWQFVEDDVLPGLDQMVAAWPGGLLALTEWAVAPAVDLGGQTPVQALRRRRLQRVLELERAIEVASW